MASRLYLHMGTMKSATTYLQALCDGNADALAKLDLGWLGSAANFSAIADFYDDAPEDRERSVSWPKPSSMLPALSRHISAASSMPAPRLAKMSVSSSMTSRARVT